MVRRFSGAVAGGAVFGIALVAGFGPLVRYEAGKAAERYGGTLSVSAVAPTWTGVRLQGIDVAIEEVPSVAIHLDEVEVQVVGGRRIALRGGVVSAVGPRDVVAGQAEAWRARHGLAAKAGDAGSTSGGTELSGLSVSWRNAKEAPTEAVAASGVSVSRQSGRLRIAAVDLAMSAGVAKIAAKDAQVELVRAEAGYRVAELLAAGVDADIELAPPARPADPEGAGTPSQPAHDPAPNRGRLLREAVMAAGRAVDALLEPDAKVRLAGVRARVRRGEETLNLGPGVFAIRREPGRLVLELSPSGGAPAPEARPGGSPAAASAGASAPASSAARVAPALPARAEAEPSLLFRLSVPLAGAPDGGGEIVADVDGGPIGLAALGVRDGDLGLADVARASLEAHARVVFSADGRRLTLDGAGKVRGLSLRNDALSDEPVAGVELAWRGKGRADLDGSRVEVDEGEVDLGAIALRARGLYERVDHAHRVRAEFEVPLTGCEAALGSIPKGLAPKLEGMRMAGTFAIKGKARFDTARIDRDFEVAWDGSNSCRVVDAPPAIQVERFQKPFRRWVYTPEGEPTEIESGPETPGWVSYGAISRFMEAAVLTTEDGGFYRHHGFDEEAIRNSIRENLKKGKFFRGASTISMQLAKNLYLDRKKNLSRKLQEAVLTMYLEQALTKEQIMELYLNVVEFGPMVYGIGPAAGHYFGTSASELSLGQALYISSILPNPKVQHFGAGGAATASWTAYLHKLMKIAHGRKRIDDADLEEGLRETVVFGSPSPMRAPRDPNAPEPIDGSAESAEPPADDVE